jgi:hypothetical protein
MTRRSEHPLFRAAALLAVLCVLALSVFAASPELHAGLHDDAPADQAAPVGDPDHECAVTLFASGATALLVFCLLLLGATTVRGIALHFADEVAASQPRYRLVPSHAPPSA